MDPADGREGIYAAGPMTHTIYALVDPRDGAIRYVGQTVNRPALRVRQHAETARRKGPTSRKNAWLCDLQSHGFHKPDVLIIETWLGSDWAAAARLEEFWIENLAVLGHDLLNDYELSVLRHRHSV